MLKKACADVLGLSQFDENIFSAEIEHIEIVAQDAPAAPNEMIFYFYDGRIISHHWVSTLKKDCWTAERKLEQSERMKIENQKRKAAKNNGESNDNSRNNK